METVLFDIVYYQFNQGCFYTETYDKGNGWGDGFYLPMNIDRYISGYMERRISPHDWGETLCSW